jgi:drug/metabolite transporter (DMT)-like permease
MDKHKPLFAHLCMFSACAIWGLMSPVGKDAMLHGIDGLSMVSFRVAGGALLFWLASLFVKTEPVPLRDRLKFAAAAVFGLVCNQCCFTIGLSLTSPGNASICTTAMPIFAMLLSFVILREPITWMKAGGVLLGCCGALLLILTSVVHADARVGNIRGDVMVLCAQLSYALFLSLFNKFIKKYSVVTVNKWMFLWATLIVWPFSFAHVAGIEWASISLVTWSETAYVVFFGTFVGYILIVNAQQVLRPTVIATYNYVQPLVAVSVALLMDIGVLKWEQALSVLLVFSGVWLVTKSKSRRDLEQTAKPSA